MFDGLVLTGVALLVACVIGVVELVKALFAADWRTAAIIAAAGVVGFLLGMAPEIGITSLQGMAVGFAASGVIKLAKSFQAVKEDSANLG